MSDLLLPAGIIASSLAMTYFFCIRPMRKGHCAMQGSRNPADTELDLALRQARTELQKIRSATLDMVSKPAGRPSDPNELSARGSDRRPEPLSAQIEG